MVSHEPHESGTPTKKRVVTLPPTPAAQGQAPPPAQDAIPHRQVWGGAAALIAAMLLIVLFPRTLHPPASATTGTAATATATHAAPTATAAPTPIPAAQAWGAQAVQFHPLTLPDGSLFIPTDSAPDGSLLAGYTAQANGNGPYRIAAITLPGFTAHLITTLPADAPAPVVRTDGQFVAWIGGPSTSGQQAPVHQTIGYSRLNSGIVVVLYDTNQLRYNPGVMALVDGRFYYSLTKTPNVLTMMDLTTGNSQRIAPQVTFAFDHQPEIQVNGVNLLYFLADGSAHVFNLQTQQDTALASYSPSSGLPLPQLNDDGVFWAQAVTTGIHIEHLALGGASTTPEQVAAIPNTASLTQLAVNDRLIAWNDGTNLTAWDRSQRMLVALHAAPKQSGTTLLARGSLLWFLTADTHQPGIDIIDTGQLG